MINFTNLHWQPLVAGLLCSLLWASSSAAQEIDVGINTPGADNGFFMIHGAGAKDGIVTPFFFDLNQDNDKDAFFIGSNTFFDPPNTLYGYDGNDVRWLLDDLEDPGISEIYLENFLDPVSQQVADYPYLPFPAQPMVKFTEFSSFYFPAGLIVSTGTKILFHPESYLNDQFNTVFAGLFSAQNGSSTIMGDRNDDLFGANHFLGYFSERRPKDEPLGLADARHNNSAASGLLVSAPLADTENGTNSGALYLFDLDDIPTDTIIDLLDSVPSSAITIAGADQNDRFGENFTVGDLNGDLYDDIIVSAPFSSAGGNNAGKIYVIYGDNGIRSFDIDLSFNSSADLTVTGYPGAYLGARGIACADINNDGENDLIMASPGNIYIYYSPAKNSSAPYLELDSDLPDVHIIMENGVYNKFAILDWDQDGYMDIFVIDGNSYNTPEYLLGFLGRSLAQKRYFYASSRDEDILIQDGFGSSVFDRLSVEDLTGDGRPDLTVGAPIESLGSENDSGVLYVFPAKVVDYSTTTTSVSTTTTVSDTSSTTSVSTTTTVSDTSSTTSVSTTTTVSDTSSTTSVSTTTTVNVSTTTVPQISSSSSAGCFVATASSRRGAADRSGWIAALQAAWNLGSVLD